MSCEVLWSAQEIELDGDRLVPDRRVGFSEAELDSVELPSGARRTPTSGSVGKGAAGTGVGLALEVAERALNDTASLIEVGIALRALIALISRRRKQRPAAANSDALAALAAAESPTVADEPEAWYHARTVPLTTDGRSGTDMRDVWAATYVNESRGLVEVTFFSSTTRYLGAAMVGVEWFFDGSEGRTRTDDQLAGIVEAWFGRDPDS